MIQLCTSFELNKKTGGFFLINNKDIVSKLDITQPYHSQYIRKMTYACFSNIL